MSDRFSLSEAQVLELVGCSAADLKQIRSERLTGDEHFIRKPRGFWFSESGLEAILAIIGASMRSVSDQSRKKAPEAAAAASGPEKKDFVVERCCPNPIWVQCRADGVLVHVRVRDNRHMVRGTRLNGCRFMAGRWAWDGKARA